MTIAEDLPLSPPTPTATAPTATMPVTAHSLVAAVLRDHPASLAVFLHRRMHCPGCSMASFMTVAEAAANYGIAAEDLIAELNAAGGAR